MPAARVLSILFIPRGVN